MRSPVWSLALPRFEYFMLTKLSILLVLVNECQCWLGANLQRISVLFRGSEDSHPLNTVYSNREISASPRGYLALKELSLAMAIIRYFNQELIESCILFKSSYQKEVRFFMAHYILNIFLSSESNGCKVFPAFATLTLACNFILERNSGDNWYNVIFVHWLSMLIVLTPL